MKAILLALAIATPAAAQNTGCPRMAEVDGLARGLRSCVVDQARRLERSGDAAESVATAALVACDGQAQTLSAQMQVVCGRPYEKVFTDEAQRLLRRLAVSAVVEKRAKR